MAHKTAGHDHPTGDEALSFLASVPGAIGHFVNAYPGVRSSDDLDWLDAWFHARINLHFSGTISATDTVQTPDSSSGSAQAQLLAQPIRLHSVHPHYFRGFREVPRPIRTDGDLVVIDGRNSSGKTSLAEALEWLFTGSLSRRESMDLGNPRELENCVSNQFRPDDDETWVSVVFESVSPGGVEALTVRRQNKWDKRGAFKACNLDANRLRQFSDLPTSVRLDSFASPPVSSPVWRLGVRGTYPPA